MDRLVHPACPGRGFPMESVMTNPTGQTFMGDNCKKRRMTEDVSHLLNNVNVTSHTTMPSVSTSKSFLPLPKCDRIFHTEEWKPRGTTLFLPLLEDILVNLKNLEQISFNRGTYFVADNDGNYSRSIEGETLNMWRYSEQDRHLYISRTFLFTHHQDFLDVQEYLQSL
ncbi:uncharacterized protein LOC135471753 [Liolophura sinensis]|uniref:uncharacterized protein LOC135471753 n=1 Tax=Liolophura sinensis TaxID=3198878 RepID=UPI0031597B43